MSKLYVKKVRQMHLNDLLRFLIKYGILLLNFMNMLNEMPFGLVINVKIM